MTVTATENVTDLSLERLRVAQDALKGIDLRSIRGTARDDVREAREAVATAIKSVRAQ